MKVRKHPLVIWRNAIDTAHAIDGFGGAAILSLPLSASQLEVLCAGGTWSRSVHVDAHGEFVSETYRVAITRRVHARSRTTRRIATIADRALALVERGVA